MLSMIPDRGRFVHVAVLRRQTGCSKTASRPASSRPTVSEICLETYRGDPRGSGRCSRCRDRRSATRRFDGMQAEYSISQPSGGLRDGSATLAGRDRSLRIFRSADRSQETRTADEERSRDAMQRSTNSAVEKDRDARRGLFATMTGKGQRVVIASKGKRSGC